jgi:hypothetical protein
MIDCLSTRSPFGPIGTGKGGPAFEATAGHFGFLSLGRPEAPLPWQRPRSARRMSLQGGQCASNELLERPRD